MTRRGRGAQAARAHLAGHAAVRGNGCSTSGATWRMALRENGTHFVPPDEVITTMREADSPPTSSNADALRAVPGRRRPGGRASDRWRDGPGVSAGRAGRPPRPGPSISRSPPRPLVSSSRSRCNRTPPERLQREPWSALTPDAEVNAAARTPPRWDAMRGTRGGFAVRVPRWPAVPGSRHRSRRRWKCRPPDNFPECHRS